MPSLLLKAYPVVGPYMDAGRGPSRVPLGYFTDLVGADGRFVGEVRPFPGCARVKDLTTVVSGLTNVDYFAYAIVMRGATSDLLRGFVVRGTHAATVKLFYIYYDTSTSAWTYTALEATGTTAGKRIGVTTYGRFLYVAVEGVATWPQVFYYDLGTSAWISAAMGPVYEDEENAAPTPTEEAGGILPIGTYNITYRFYNSIRGVRSGMSARASITTVADDEKIEVVIDQPAAGSDNFDRVEVFRTLNVEVAGSSYQGGLLFPDVDEAIAWSAAPAKHTTYVGVTNSDIVLAQTRPFEPLEDAVGPPPLSGVVRYYQGALCMASDPATGGGAGLVWSAVGSFDLENFSPAHSYPERLEDGRVISLVEAGDVLYALTNSVVCRLRKMGAQLSIHRLHFGRGVTAPGAAHSVGDDMLMLTPIGFGIVTGQTGDMQVYTSLDGIAFGDWQDSLGDVVSAYDGPTAASYFVNPTLAEAVAVWHTSKTACRFEDCNFIGASTGPHPVNGGSPRAMFVTATGIVVCPDAELSGTRTMLGIAAGKTLIGTTTAVTALTGDAYRLKDLPATFDATMVGAYLHYRNPAGDWLRATITAVNAGAHTVDIQNPTAQTAPLLGCKYSISPVVFSATFPPLPSDYPDRPDSQRRIVKAVNVIAFGVSGGGEWVAGAVADGADDPAALQYKAMADGLVPLPVSAAGCLVQPHIACRSAGADFTLTGVEVVSTISRSRSVD